MESSHPPSICLVSPNELHKLRSKSSFARSKINGLTDILSDLEIPMKEIAIISAKSDLDPVPAPIPDEEDKENVSPPYSPNSSYSSVENDTDESGKPLPLQKLANLSVVTSPLDLDQLFDKQLSSLRQMYFFRIVDRIPEVKARTLLSTILVEIKRNSLPSWMPDGLAIIVPFADQAPPFTSLASGLVIAPKCAGVRSVNVKCLQENIPRNRLPELQDLKRRLGKIARLNETPQERYEAVFSLGAVSSDEGGCHVTVRYTAQWDTCSRILDRPTAGKLGQLLVRPLIGHPKSQLHFIFEAIERLKVLSTAVSTYAQEWDSDVDVDSFSKTLLPNFRQLCIVSDALDKQRVADDIEADAEVDCSLLRNPSDPAPRWRNVVARRKRDVTEVLWIVLRDVNDYKNLRRHMKSLLNYLITEKLNYSVESSNDSGLAFVLRRLCAHGVPDLSNALELLIEVGFYALHRDLSAILEAIFEKNKKELDDLRPLLRFFAEEGTTAREERLRRLGRLYRACEFATLLSQHTPRDEVGKNIRHVFSVLKKDAKNELLFRCVTTSFLSLDQEAPTSWSVTLGYSNGLWIKELFKRSSHDVIDNYDPSLAKFTRLEILGKPICD